MPIHDWTRVTAGTFHDFHHAWLTELRNALNGGLLPSPYYAQAEPIAGPFGPDRLALQADEPDEPGASGPVGSAVATRPQARVTARAEVEQYARKRKSVVVRHTSGDRIVALVEVVSPGNKASRHEFRAFVETAYECLAGGYHLLVVDLFPPTRRDPRGVHAAVWAEFDDDYPWAPPADEPLTLAAYTGRPVVEAWAEPTAVGRGLAPMPLFLSPPVHVPVPLEDTYQAAYRGVPGRWKRVLDGPAG